MLWEHKISNIFVLLFFDLFFKLIREHWGSNSLVGYLFWTSHLTFANSWPLIFQLHDSWPRSSINSIDVLIILRDLDILGAFKHHILVLFLFRGNSFQRLTVASTAGHSKLWHLELLLCVEFHFWLLLERRIGFSWERFKALVIGLSTVNRSNQDSWAKCLMSSLQNGQMESLEQYNERVDHAPLNNIWLVSNSKHLCIPNNKKNHKLY